jgi:hypothetical protein
LGWEVNLENKYRFAIIVIIIVLYNYSTKRSLKGFIKNRKEHHGAKNRTLGMGKRQCRKSVLVSFGSLAGSQFIK